jgi:hypothetical protein
MSAAEAWMQCLPTAAASAIGECMDRSKPPPHSLDRHATYTNSMPLIQILLIEISFRACVAWSKHNGSSFL